MVGFTFDCFFICLTTGVTPKSPPNDTTVGKSTKKTPKKRTICFSFCKLRKNRKTNNSREIHVFERSYKAIRVKYVNVCLSICFTKKNV